MKIINMVLFLVVIGALCVAGPALAEEAQSSENMVEIGTLSCKQLMRGNDSEREIGLAFYHGYLAGKADKQSIDLPAASAVSDRVRDYCLSNPASTVMDAFQNCLK